MKRWLKAGVPVVLLATLLAVLLASGLVVGLSSPALADFQLSAWPYYRDLAGAGEGYVAVELDAPLFDRARPDLDDLRVIDGEGREVPYYLSVKRGRSEEKTYPARVLNNVFVTGSHSSLVLDLGKKGLLHNRIELSISSANFMREVAVDGSDDQATWHRLRTGAVIAGISQDTPFRNTAVTYPDSNYRYLRVTVKNGQERPLEITGATVWYRLTRGTEEFPYAGRVIDQGGNPEDHFGYTVIDLGYQNLPVHRVSLTTPAAGFHRRVGVAVSPDGKDWRPAGEGFVYRFNLGGYQDENLVVTFPEARGRYLRLTVFNQDNPPLVVGDISTYGLVRQLIFRREPGRSYRLYYGNQQAGIPQYDVAQFSAYLEGRELPTLTLGPVGDNPSYVYLKPRRPWTEERPWLLWLILAGVVTVVGSIIVRTMAGAGREP